MDRRQQKTRSAVFGAFTALLAKKSYHSITVREIIAAADVGRTTFYAHFPTKDDLLREMCVDLFDHVFAAVPQSEGGHDFSASEPDAAAAVAHILWHLKENDRGIAGILRRDSDTPFLTFFREYIDDYIAAGLVASGQGNPAVPAEFLRRHVTATFVSLVQWWIAEGMRETPERLTEIFLAVIYPPLGLPLPPS